MTKTRAILFSLWLTFALASILFTLYLTAQLISLTYALEQHQPPTQTEAFLRHIEQERIDNLEQRIRELEDIFSRAETYTVTAYTHAAPGGCINGTGDGITASGIPVREGLVAVDPKVIPLGTEIWVQGFGRLLAADVGGAIKGNRLDVFMECRKAAIEFGRQSRKVVIP